MRATSDSLSGLRSHRYAPHGDTPVGQPDVFAARRDEDVGAVALQVGLGLAGHGLRQRDERDHRGDADQEARDQERRAGLAAAQVVDGDGAKPHAITPLTGRAARRWVEPAGVQGRIQRSDGADDDGEADGGAGQGRRPRDGHAVAGEQGQEEEARPHAGQIAEHAGEQARGGGLDEDEAGHVAAAEAEGAEDADLAGAGVDRAHHGDEHDQRLDGDDDAGDDVAEGAELVDGVHAVLDLLLHRRDRGARENAAELGDDLLHGAVAAEGGHLDHRHLAGLVEDRLRGRQVGDEQVVVLRAGRPQDAGDRERPPAHGSTVSFTAQVQGRAAVRAGHELVAVARRPPVHRPPLLELELIRRPHSHEEPLPALDLDYAEQLGRHDGDIAPVGDGGDARQVRFADVARPHRHAAQRDAAVVQREPVAARRDDDVGAEGLQVVLRLHGERRAQREERHDRADAQQQADDEERGASLAPAQVAEGDVSESHSAEGQSGIKASRALVTGSTARWPAGCSR